MAYYSAFTNGYQWNAFQVRWGGGSHRDTHDGGHFVKKKIHLPIYTDGKKHIPGNIQFIYDKAKELPTAEIVELKEAIADFTEPFVALPDFSSIEYERMSQEAYEKFTDSLRNIEKKLGIFIINQQAEDDELMLISLIACTIN